MRDAKVRCLVGYTTELFGRGVVYNRKFSELKSCCNEFECVFVPTIGRGVWDGIILSITEGGVVLLFDRMYSIKFCPFCGAEVEVKETKAVKMKPKYKQVQVQDGFEKEVVRQSDL